jgi:Sec-independent protein secretion pathway component TatC
MFDAVFAELQRPIVELSNQPGSNATINFPTVVSAFDVRLQVSIFLGVMMSSPVWLFQHLVIHHSWAQKEGAQVHHLVCGGSRASCFWPAPH